MEQKDSNKIMLKLKDKSYEFPLVTGSENEVALDISSLRSQTGIITLDPAYMNTASCESKITFLDGEKGILRYRGYPIESLAERASFLDVSYLLFYGELASRESKQEFEEKISTASKISPNMLKFLDAYPSDAHPMAMLSGMMLYLSSKPAHSTVMDLGESERVQITIELLAQTKGLVAAIYRKIMGLEIVPSSKKLNYVSDFLKMMFYKTPHYTEDPEIEMALNVLLILHADHEQNCSTSSVRLVGSSKANPYAAIASGINALWGPLHGGANQAVIEMLEAIHREGGGHKKYLQKAKDKDDPFRLMGFGHRVYKNFDPRAKIIKKACDTILKKLGIKDPLLDLAKGLEEEALQDSYFIDRNLYPNVDFYSGIIYKALNIPVNMFTVMFAFGRMSGWLAQWNEMLESPTMKIGRPRQIYTGQMKRDYPKSS